ncbi:MAG: hypothetical protein EOS71_03730 [Mesorhizobium sp.]|nr:MAG: hypothetical protein EOS71_03730 [Mesorhizobium sp.]
MSAQASAAMLFDPEDSDESAAPPKPPASKAERRLMDLQRALKRALIRKRNALGAVEIAANAVFEIARQRSTRNFEPAERLSKWCARRGLRVSKKALATITEKWRDAGYLMTIEDCGWLLSLSPKQRVDNKLWSLGALNETAEERHERKWLRQADARTKKRQADRERIAAKRRADGARPRTEYETKGVTDFCRRHGLVRYSYQKAEARGRDSLLAFLAKKGVSEPPPEKLATVSRGKRYTYVATHLPTLIISLSGRPEGRSALASWPRDHRATMLDRAANALATAPRRVRPRAAP